MTTRPDGAPMTRTQMLSLGAFLLGAFFTITGAVWNIATGSSGRTGFVSNEPKVFFWAGAVLVLASFAIYAIFEPKSQRVRRKVGWREAFGSTIWWSIWWSLGTTCSRVMMRTWTGWWEVPLTFGTVVACNAIARKIFGVLEERNVND